MPSYQVTPEFLRAGPCYIFSDSNQALHISYLHTSLMSKLVGEGVGE